MASKTVGKFSIDADGVLSGPATYCDLQGDALIRRILDGDDAIFNATCHQSPDAETAILVRLQTDYAGWKGLRDFMDDHQIA